MGNLISSIQKFVPTGTLFMWSINTAPDGWLVCDGSAVSRTIYADLYSVIGDTFGEGDGSTTFNLPDCQGRFPRGRDNSSGRDPDTTGRTAMNTGGAVQDNVGSVQAPAFELHAHQGDGGQFLINSSGEDSPVAAGLHGANLKQTNTQTSGGNETRPINFYINFIIKY